MIIIGISTFRELIRQRLVHIGLLIAFLIFALSEAIGSASMSQEARVLFHFGFSAVQISVVGISLLIGCYILPREVERQTCLIVLSRPISRAQFFLGKMLGIALVNLCIVVMLTVLLWFMVSGDFAFLGFVKVGFGIYLESLIVLALAFWASQSLRPAAIGFFLSIGIFIMGHWLEELMYFAEKSKNEFYLALAKVTHATIPHLYSLDWKSFYLLESNGISASEVGSASLHSLGWIVLFIVFGLWSFRRKDLV